MTQVSGLLHPMSSHTMLLVLKLLLLFAISGSMHIFWMCTALVGPCVHEIRPGLINSAIAAQVSTPSEFG